MLTETENRELGMDEVPSTEELTKALNPLYIEPFKNLPEFKDEDIMSTTPQEPTDEQLLFSKDSTSWNDLPSENAIIEYTIMPTASDASILQFEHMLHVANADRPSGFLGGCIRSMQAEQTLYPVLFFLHTPKEGEEEIEEGRRLSGSERRLSGSDWIHQYEWYIIFVVTLSTSTNGKLVSKFLEDIHNYQRDVSKEDKHLTLFLSDTFLGRSIEDALRHDKTYASLLEAHTHVDNEDWHPDFTGNNFIYTK